MWMKTLIEWDGKTVAELIDLYVSCHESPEFEKILNECLKSTDHNVQKAGSWILKYHIEEGSLKNYTKMRLRGKMKRNPETESSLSEHLSTLIQNVNDESPWEVKLHLFQVLRYIEVRSSDERSLKTIVDKGLKSEKKFVRAWAYDGLYRLMLQYSKYENDFEEVISRALAKESGAVMARIRNILKEDKLS